MLYADVSELHALEPVGLPDEAWQRLYERIAQQRGPASQVPISLYCLSKFVTLLGAVQILVQPPLVCLKVDVFSVLSFRVAKESYRGKFGCCPADAEGWE